VLGLEREIGSVEAGKRADLIVVGVNRARQTPLYDAISHLVYTTRGDDVETTIVNGKVLMRGRRVETLDESSVLEEANRFANRIRDAVRAR
jgi:5-methylthioadenosine/S-adenosylhomocysteine deaminase